MMAQVHLRAGKISQKNDIEFRSYRKFSGDATIKFDDVAADPIPEDKTQEQPATAQPLKTPVAEPSSTR